MPPKNSRQGTSSEPSSSAAPIVDDDYPNCPFIGTDRLVEKSGENIYGCAFNPYIPEDEDQVAVVVAGENVILYKLPLNEKKLERLGEQGIAKKEELWTVTWAYDSLDRKKEHKIVTAGSTGVIYVVDASTLKIDKRLVGHGNSVNDVRSCPTDFGLVASASHDCSVRVWHIREDSCLLILGTRLVLMDQIATVDWSPDSTTLISCGFNHRVITWNMQDPLIQEHMRICQERIDEGIPVGKVEVRQPPPSNVMENHEAVFNLDGHSLIYTDALHIIGDIHFHCIDSLRAIEIDEQLYIVSKSTGSESSVAFWRFGTLHEKENKSKGVPLTNHVKFWKKFVDGGEAWFSKLALDPRNKWVVVGASGGRVHFYDMRDMHKKTPELTLRVGATNHGITRQIDFSPDGSMILVVGDCGFVGRLDRVAADCQTKPKNTWKVWKSRKSITVKQEIMEME